MAVLQSMPQPTGVVAEYHRIRRLAIDYDAGTVEVEIAGYLSEKARRDGAAPMTAMNMTLRGYDPKDDPRAWAYAQMKATEHWSDAKDA